LQVFVGNTRSPIGATVNANGTLNFGSQATLIYDLDGQAVGDTTIQLDYNLNSGSGQADMIAYIRNDLFVGGTFVTLYSQFGTPPGDFANNDGYEEWAVKTSETVPPGVPEPATILSAVTGLASLGLFRLRRRRQPA